MAHNANWPKRHPSRGIETPASQPARRLRPMYPIVIAAIMLLTSCGQPQATAPTVQAAATQVVGTVQSAVEQVAPTVQAARTEVRATIQTGATQIAPTVQAARTEVRATIQTGATQIAPTVQTARTEVRATIQTGATQIAPTVQTRLTEVAPTMQVVQATVEAAQTQIAPTTQAIATMVAATIGPPIATSVAASPVQIADVSVSQDDTRVALASKGAQAANISGWVLMIGTFPLVLPTSTHLRIDPNETVTLHMSRGSDTDSDVYLGQAPELLVKSMQPGTRFVLVNPQGEIANIYRLP
jgi:hypothetical protein